MNPLSKSLHRLDRLQQAHRGPAFVVAVVRKLGDDRTGQLSALITYYGFTAVFPLLLLLTTTLGFVLRGNTAAQRAVLDSALADFPIIGNQLTANVHSLHGTGAAVVAGGLGLLYGSLGVTQALQFAMAQVWNIPEVDRPGYLDRLGRGLLLLVALAAGLLLSAATAGLAGFVARGPLAYAAGLLGSAAVNTGLYLVSFRILTPEEIPLRQLLPGCLLAGPAWTALQTGGGYLIAHELRHSTQVYGFFGTVLGLLSWLYLGAQITMCAAEINVVRTRRLWPRTLLQPPLTQADRRVLDALVHQEERRPEQRVESFFVVDAVEAPQAVPAAPPERAEPPAAAAAAGAEPEAGLEGHG
ncbi:YihY/virulence factor BrkB family protein [Streptacidiphilus sp. PB12-B1b]|uniref:YihY/virulence factor BrkB family protein n=1 Tax=Streptacidiphilus sp. PB12-B1b TaxID=2705012 RepID=UPI0015FC7B67|nr:YhjD/YihY/BrkB family envelope integrity protein [Streptacidiphilus sp. PB12-B1b]QMU77079.1 YihY/virulence factor BrkB family protein [Streptacidiphilus sp. PB12-B1b]